MIRENGIDTEKRIRIMFLKDMVCIKSTMKDGELGETSLVRFPKHTPVEFWDLADRGCGLAQILVDAEDDNNREYLMNVPIQSFVEINEENKIAVHFFGLKFSGEEPEFRTGIFNMTFEEFVELNWDKLNRLDNLDEQTTHFLSPYKHIIDMYNFGFTHGVNIESFWEAVTQFVDEQSNKDKPTDSSVKKLSDILGVKEGEAVDIVYGEELDGDSK